MPRIHSPSAQQLASHPREFALLKQLLAGAADGTVGQEALDKLVAQYGNKEKAAGGAELSFDEFAGVLQRPSSSASDGEGNCIGWAAKDATSPLAPWRFSRRETRPTDVRIQITHAGICHSDIHQVRNEWGNSTYPMVPGHEIAGIVTEVGAEVTKFKVGDRVGVGCLVNSCQKKECLGCTVMKEEQFCLSQVQTYNGKDVDGAPTYGGYSTHVLVNHKFVIRVPDALPLSAAAPLLCAGITTYSPIRKFGFDKPGLRIGVVGLGGLGHMAVQFLKALGVDTTVISRSPNKKEEALKVLKADHFLVSSDEEDMKKHAVTLDGILNTVAAKHELAPLFALMKPDTTMVCVGAPPVADPLTVPSFPMILARQRLAGSPIGGIAQTQECLDFCAEKGIQCMTEMINADYINTAYDRVTKGDVRYRFVIDIQGSLIA